MLVPATLIASIIIFCVVRALPGDVVIVILSGSGEATHSLEVREELREELGLNESGVNQYVKWLVLMTNGEMGGRSLIDGQPIQSLISQQLPVTALLLLYAILLSSMIWIPLGIIAAWTQGTWIDYTVRFLAVPGGAIPSFVLALILLLALLLLLDWSPPIVYAGPFEDPITHLQIVSWPTILLVWGCGSTILGITRASMLSVLHENYILVARSKGVPTTLIILRHAMPNALAPVISALGLQLGILLSTLMILEPIFSLPGIGRGLIDAATTRDLPFVQSISTLLVLAILILNLILDITSKYLTSGRSSAGGPVHWLMRTKPHG
jgi:peptide/nickel transport system permease protein